MTPSPQKLTPYDTGSRLESKLWPTEKTDADSFGRVDFDDDESMTAFTVHSELQAATHHDTSARPAYNLHVENVALADLAITVSERPALVLDDRTAKGLEHLIQMAKACDKFLRTRVEAGDFSPLQVHKYRLKWARVTQTVNRIEEMLASVT